MEIGLVKHIHVDPLRNIPARPEEAPDRIILLGFGRWEPPLDVQPLRILRHVINGRQRGADPLLDEICAKRTGPQEELGDPRSDRVAGRKVAEQRAGGYDTVDFWPAKIRERGEV